MKRQGEFHRSIGSTRIGVVAALIAAAALPGSAFGAGAITYTAPEGGGVFRIAAQAGADPQNVSRELDALSPRAADNWLNISPDGRWLLVETERFGCEGWACMALVRSDFSRGAAIRAGGDFLRSEGFSAVASGGKRIVYTSQDGPHDVDLWSVRRIGASFGAPRLLTGKSRARYNRQPAISGDGKKVLFDCGPDPYEGARTELCKVATTGGKVRVVVPHRKGRVHHGDFGRNGSIVFEASWPSTEQIWRLGKGKRKPVKVSRTNNEVAPCVLPDGRVANLWLSRPANRTGLHELVVKNRAGRNVTVLTPLWDVLDIGIGCGRSR